MKPAAIMLVPSGGRPPLRWLVVRRPEPPHEWAIPGGLIERGESPAAAAAREVAEETGVHIDPSSITPLGTTTQGTRTVHVLVGRHWSGPAWAAEGWPVGWLTWRELRGQAARYGAVLDQIAVTLQRRGLG